MDELSRSGIIAVVLAALLAGAGCGGARQAENLRPPPVYFPASEVCAYPRSGPGKIFANLGGGSWTSSSPEVAGSVFECVGSNPQVQLLKEGDSAIQVEFAATGTEEGAAFISLTYTAIGSGTVPNESTYRNAFSNLISAIVRRSLGEPPPDLFKKKLLNLASYSSPGKGRDESFDVGRGFLTLAREAAGDTDVKVVVKLFPDTALKLQR